jgi:hypothetical protein
MRLDHRYKILEILGGALLLISFTVQNFVYDKWQSRSDQLREAITDQSTLDKSVLLNETLYFLVATGDTSLSNSEIAEIRRQKIREAARKLYFSQVASVMASDLGPIQKNSLVETLRTAATSVQDYRSYSDFVGKVNDISRSYISPGRLVVEIDGKKDMARWLFLGLYCIGSVFLLIGVAFKP